MKESGKRKSGTKKDARVVRTIDKLKRTMLDLLKEHSYDEIKITELCEAAGVNRNTFYYHFRDIPQLVETIVEEDAERIIKETSAMHSLEECLRRAIGFALLHRSAVLNIYASERSTFELSLWRVSEHVVRTYISSNSDSARNHRQEAIVYYLKCVLFGLVSGWLESGMDDDILKELSEISELKHGSLADLLERI